MAIPKSVQIVAGNGAGPLTAREILNAIVRINPSCEIILIEGGPHLMGEFFAERFLDELFLTLSPQVAGRESSIERLGIVAEKIFAPDHPLWGKLISVKRGGSHLFLRYGFETAGH
jgi:riboflavin biosynthesis pyrimidine reductase